ncbi:MAG TPA: serine hydrolase [Methylomirabilota bacterium]|nr:serine hydrolase [Methylomirabilota bacterium]
MRRITLGLGIVIALAMLHLGSVVPAVADATAVINDRSVTVPTAWWLYTGVDAAFLTNKIQQDGARITDLEVQSTSPYRFTAALVKNAGAYAVPAWWWYFGLTAAQVTDRLNANQARLIDLEPYVTSSGVRFAAVMVSNTGSFARAWWWYQGVSAAFLSQKLTENQARLIDLDSYVVNGTRVFSGVMIRNTGADAKQWWWYVNVPPGFVSAKLIENRARLVDYERRPDGRLDVVMHRREGEYWWWYYGLPSAQAVVDKALQKGARVIDIERYTDGGQTRFAAILLDNSNAETRRLWAIMDPGLSAGRFGIYLKQVGGGVKVDLQGGTIFEPASAIKVLHHAHAMRRVQVGLDSLSSNFVYFVKPDDPNNKDICPLDAPEVDANKRTTTLQDGLAKTMQNSDNRTTRGLQLRYGQAALNARADSLGMSNTELRQVLGCGFRNNLRNDLTLVDVGKLYEAVANGSLLTGSSRTTFYNIMLGGGIGSSSALATIVRQEATALGKSAAAANAFIAQMDSRFKGGSYDICITSCNPYFYYRSNAGRMTLPFKSGTGAIVPVHYVFGQWANDLSIPCGPGVNCSTKVAADNALGNAGNELFRKEIRQALQTW